jgi:hypothetical protein
MEYWDHGIFTRTIINTQDSSSIQGTGREEEEKGEATFWPRRSGEAEMVTEESKSSLDRCRATLLKG